MKTLAAKDITEVLAEDVKIGMVVLEGLIVNVTRNGQRGGKSDTMFFDHVDKSTTFAQVGSKVQVYAKMEQNTLDAILETLDEQ